MLLTGPWGCPPYISVIAISFAVILAKLSKLSFVFKLSTWTRDATGCLAFSHYGRQLQRSVGEQPFACQA